MRSGFRVRVVLAAFLLAAWLPGEGPSAAPAQEPSDDPLYGPRVEELERRFLQRVGEALSLDEAGVRRLGVALAETRLERRKNADRRRAVRAELAAAATATHPDQERVGRLLDEWSEIQLREAEISREERRRLAEVLTPVQQARFLYLRQRFIQAAIGRGRDGGPPADARRRPRGRDEPPPRRSNDRGR